MHLSSDRIGDVYQGGPHDKWTARNCPSTTSKYRTVGDCDLDPTIIEQWD